jgi:hypothetical protein
VYAGGHWYHNTSLSENEEEFEAADLNLNLEAVIERY